MKVITALAARQIVDNLDDWDTAHYDKIYSAISAAALEGKSELLIMPLAFQRYSLNHRDLCNKANLEIEAPEIIVTIGLPAQRHVPTAVQATLVELGYDTLQCMVAVAGVAPFTGLYVRW